MEFTYTVSQLVFLLKERVEAEFGTFTLVGEISNYSSSPSGHYYFQIKDERATLSGCLFKGDAFRNPEARGLKDGDQIECVGELSLYPKRGSLQVIVKKIKKLGTGDLKEKFEKLKLKLSSEGLFDIDSKRKIPQHNQRIAVVTSPTGAAVIDFLQIFKRRSSFMEVLISPAIVQGEKSAKSIVQALKRILDYHKEKNPIDVVVVTRGGGSIEDLWSFNEELVVRALHKFPLPIISAVGHEVDFTLSDFVADLRLETPSAAAEFLTQSQTNFLDTLFELKKKLNSGVAKQIKDRRYLLEKSSPKRALERSLRQWAEYRHQLDKLKPDPRWANLQSHYLEIDDSMKRISGNIESKIESKKANMLRLKDLIYALNPQNILERGYSFVKLPSGKIVGSYTEFNKLKSMDSLEVVFHDGKGDIQKI